MNIAILSFYSGINDRGVERWVYEIGNEFSKENEVEVFQNRKVDNGSDYTQIPFNLNYSKNHENRLGFLKSLFLDYKSIKVLFFSLKILPRLILHKYDIVIPTDGGWESALVRFVTWTKRCKMVIVGHAGIGIYDLNNLWSFPDLFVALSTQALLWAKRVNPFVKSCYIPNGVDIDKFSPSGVRYKTKLKKPIVLTTSSLSKEKRLDLVIRTVSKIDGVSLLMCGKGSLKDYLEKMGKDMLGERFASVFAKPGEMPEIYRCADVFVSSSNKHLAFEMNILEAMASGLPVVVNDDPIRREIAGEVGVYVDPADIQKLAKGINEALRNNNSVQIRKQADKFSWTKVFKQYETEFKGVLGLQKDVVEDVL